MKIKIACIIFFTLFISDKLLSQVGSWVFVGGDTLVPGYDLGIFGIKGVADSANSPGSLYSPACWTDKNGKFWMYGGTRDYGPSNVNDMWMYDPDNGMWTWIEGDSGRTNELANSIHAVLGGYSPLNKPGVRTYGSATWVDTSGNFWLFGGDSFDDNDNAGTMNDLWKYNVDSNLWTWVKGSASVNDTGSFGIMGVPDTSNNPPFNKEIGACWVDNNNNLWFYGGKTEYALWRYNISTNEWTWMNKKGLTPVYGTKGIPDTANTPGRRIVHAHWKDNNGDFWLWGGAYDLVYELCYNDLWRYSVSLNAWTWMSGGMTPGLGGTNPALCLSGDSIEPPGEYENRMCWKDSLDNFYMFGGIHSYPTNSSVFGWDDIWCYKTSTNQWSRLKRSLPVPGPRYGTVGIPDIMNTPYTRCGTGVWQDKNGIPWMYSGHIYGWGTSSYPNATADLWKFIPDSCPNFVITEEVELSKYDYSISQIEGDNFNIDFNDEIKSIKRCMVYSLQGKLIADFFPLKYLTFSMEGRSKGIYFCLLELKSGEKISKKFIFR